MYGYFLFISQIHEVIMTLTYAILETYRAKLSGGELQYPYLPSVNCGSATHPVLIPPELLLVSIQIYQMKCTHLSCIPYQIVGS